MPTKTKEINEEKVKPAKKETVKKEEKKATKKANTSTSATKATTKKSTATKTTAKKATTTKKTTTKKASTTKTVAKKTTTRKVATKKAKTIAEVVEYYDLPYRYNETTVKILAQTPTTLFVYWDISDDDRNTLIQKHGENVFYDTKPILIVHNITKNYSFEVEINDFANSWYIRTQEPNCNYVIELGRRKIDKPEEYIYIHSSNNIISPNDHILFENVNLGNILFRNVKTNTLSSKDFGSLKFINDMDKLYGNLYDVYSRLYKDETINELTMPTSGGFINR